jgi:hypothetical protein
MEYASPVWDPHHQTDIRKLESVQRRAARFVLSSQHNRSSVTAMNQRLSWSSLEDRRRDARLTMLYKIDHELVAISKTDRLDRTTRRLRQSHDNAYQVPHCGIDVRKMSFFPRTVRDWNALQPDKASLDTKLQCVSNKPPRLLLSFNLFLTYPDVRLPLMHSTYLNHCMIFDTTKEAVNRQKQKQKHAMKTLRFARKLILNIICY